MARLSLILVVVLLNVGLVESLRGTRPAEPEPAAEPPADPPIPDERVAEIQHDAEALEEAHRGAADGAPSAPVTGEDGEHNPDFDADALGAEGAETWDAAEHERRMNSMLHEGFPKWDLDSDGKLSRDELRTQLEAVAASTRENEAKRTKADAADAFAKLTDIHGLDADLDRDGVLSLEELAKTRDKLMQARGLIDGEHVRKPEKDEDKGRIT